MKRNELLNRINSKYILANIFQYIKVEDSKLKLFLYSKNFQEQLECQLEE